MLFVLFYIWRLALLQRAIVVGFILLNNERLVCYSKAWLLVVLPTNVGYGTWFPAFFVVVVFLVINIQFLVILHGAS